MRAAVDPTPHVASQADHEPREKVLPVAEGEAARAWRCDLVQAAEALAWLWRGRVHAQGIVTRKGLISTRAKTPPVT